jgi:exodeoxyribonuclease V beta subunit
MVTAAPHFRLDGPLPTGLTVLEASAGTGKTYAIAGLVVRYVALEGVRLPRLLVVTFTRAATAELRERVRRRLAQAATHLDRVLADGSGATGDELLDLLARGDREALALRRRRLRLALGEFDAATIATIHGFCQHMLGGVGLSGDVDRRATLVEDQQELVDAAVDDCYLRAFHRGTDAPPVTRGTLRAIAGKLVGNPEARIVPEDADDDAVRWRVRLAHAVRADLDRRKRTAGVLSYDDLLTRLVEALRDEGRGPAARSRLRQAYDVALIDEFQDTDPIQWEILFRAFRAPGKTLVLIGDPKQAIYAFRGADVYAYLRAARFADERWTLGVNWRSDAGLLEACNVLFDNAELGHSHILYRAVEAAPPHTEPRLVGTAGPPLELRVVRRDAEVRTYGTRPLVNAHSARAFIARDVAAEAVALLSSDARLVARDHHGAETSPRAVQPGDLAVLVRTNAEATLVQAALRTAGVPAVINGVGSVFATPAALEWLRLLEALERPAAPDRARAAALTAFLGWSAGDIAAADDAAFEPVHDHLHAWAGVLRDRSVAALVRTQWVEQRVPARLLGRDDGERLLTDLEHIGELLHAAATAENLGVTALAGWLRERMAEAEQDVTSDERARRLESDARAVQVLTIHRAKGLQFPIVLCPYLWSSGRPDGGVPLFHDDDDRRAIDVGGGGRDDFAEHTDRADRERHGENLRLLYVAVTRACHRVVLWWAPCAGSWESPLGRVLFCRTRRGVRTTAKPQLPDDDGTLARLEQLAEPAGGLIGVTAIPADPQPGTWTGTRGAGRALAAAAFDRPLDQQWRRTSYSALTRPADDSAVGSEPGETVVDDEPALAAAAAASAEAVALQAHRCPLGPLPGGTEFGTFVHGVLERVDFAAADLPRALTDAVAAQRGYRPTEVGAVDVLVDGLRRAIETPLGPLADDRALRAVGRTERSDELAFELPLAHGDGGSGSLTLAAVADLLRDHLPPDDPLAAYPDRLADPLLGRVLRGYLIGSIDSVLRLPGPRYVVVDYKTNRLAPPDEELTAHHYRPAALAEAMIHGHYPLQALLYAVALHRFLRWRQPGYDPARHLAGIAYLFVRGMTGADAPRVGQQPCGVFTWAPGPDLVTALSDLLHDGAAA